nr:signal peptide peptidase SppA [Clostridia bacterium]
MKRKQILGLIAAAIVFVLVGLSGIAAASYLRGSFVLFDTEIDPEPIEDYVAVIDIVGTIGETTYDMFGNPTSSYDHNAILDRIWDLTESEHNKGLLLYIDSGGGAVYETDEVYLALMEYKEVTGRPIYVYAAHTMASGAYYIACAADKIYANRNATVGSIGVYIQTVNYAGLYEKLGIEGEYIRSGANKAMGNAYDHLSEEQRAIYQSVVDECYDQFLDIVMESRGYSYEEAAPICDGRIYTAIQAVDNGLIDETNCGYADALDDLMELCGVEEYEEQTYYYNDWTALFSRLAESVSKTETERLIEFSEANAGGRPMYQYVG